ncbi:Uncharacterised protein [uncultured archaeon]|nr:Uncharacterised protein [uncultured archaeon]
MDSDKINIKALKITIFGIAKNNGTTLAEIVKTKKLKSDVIKDHVIFLKNLGLFDLENSEVMPAGENRNSKSVIIKFKPNIETVRKIANVLDDKELSKLMITKYYKDNLESYCKYLTGSLNENRLYQLPDPDYFEYGMRCSPSVVRFFTVDNDMNALKSLYQKSIVLANEKEKDKTRIELLKKCNMYFIWDNIIFEKIQEDKRNKILFDSANYFAGYLPLAKRSVDRLLELNGLVKKEGTEDALLNSGLKDYLKSLLPD